MSQRPFVRASSALACSFVRSVTAIHGIVRVRAACVACGREPTTPFAHVPCEAERSPKTKCYYVVCASSIKMRSNGFLGGRPRD